MNSHGRFKTCISKKQQIFQFNSNTFDGKCNFSPEEAETNL